MMVPSVLLRRPLLSSRCSRWHRVPRPRRVDGATCHAIDAMPHAELNPRATVLETTNSAAPLDQLLLTNRFDFEATSTAAGWVQSLKQAGSGRDTTLGGIGFQNFVYKKRTPFHPKRLHDFLAEHFVFYEVSQGSGDSSVGDDSVDLSSPTEESPDPCDTS